MMEKKEFPSVYKHTETEAKKLGLDLVKRNITPVVVQDSTSCPHDFILEGMYAIKCKLCGWGLATNGVKDSQDLIARLTKKEA